MRPSRINAWTRSQLSVIVASAVGRCQSRGPPARENERANGRRSLLQQSGSTWTTIGLPGKVALHDGCRVAAATCTPGRLDGRLESRRSKTCASCPEFSPRGLCTSAITSAPQAVHRLAARQRRVLFRCRLSRPDQRARCGSASVIYVRRDRHHAVAWASIPRSRRCLFSRTCRKRPSWPGCSRR